MEQLTQKKAKTNLFSYDISWLSGKHKETCKYLISSLIVKERTARTEAIMK